MSFDADRLYNLLPAIYRIRDGEQNEPLKALLAVIAAEVALLEDDLEQRYADHFIETCADWVVPYIGDLIGYRALHGVAPSVSSPRAEVAHTIAYRRRKGTAAMLEQLARDVSGWNSAVVEYFLRLSTTQYMNHVRGRHAYAPDLRHWEALERLDTPFDGVPRTADVRHIEGGDGLYNIPNVGVYLWRLAAYPTTDSPVFKVDDRRYMFGPLGNNTPLFTSPTAEADIAHLAEPINAPLPISRRVLDQSMPRGNAGQSVGPFPDSRLPHLGKYYGLGKSLLLKKLSAAGSYETIAAADSKICDLSDVTGAGGNVVGWAHMPTDNKTAIDPVLGRIALPAAAAPATLLATFHSGFSADMGGGEYPRGYSFNATQAGQVVVEVAADRAAVQTALATPNIARLTVQIKSHGVFAAPPVTAGAHQSIELRAADRHRPLVELTEELVIAGGDDSEVTLNGLLIANWAIRVPAQGGANKLRRLRLRHCTLVPGLELTRKGDPRHPDKPSLIVEVPDLVVEIDRCIIGSLRIAPQTRVQITNSIVDATSDRAVAYAQSDDGKTAGGSLEIRNSTVIGNVHTAFLRIASNTIFAAAPRVNDASKAPIRSQRRQHACVRFSYVPVGSRVPRQFRCQPNRDEDANRVQPRLTSWRYGHPAYGQLDRSCCAEIRRGADDQASMGAFHDLYEPQREANVRLRMDEYLRFGLEAGVRFAADGPRGDNDER